MKAANLKDLIVRCRDMRRQPGIHAIRADLYRDMVLTAAEAAAAKDLQPPEEDFLRAACAGVQGLADDLDRAVYIPAAQLQRLAGYIGDEAPATAATPPPRRPRRRRAKQSAPTPDVADLARAQARPTDH